MSDLVPISRVWVNVDVRQWRAPTTPGDAWCADLECGHSLELAPLWKELPTEIACGDCADIARDALAKGRQDG